MKMKSILGMTGLVILTSCSVERIDRCKTTISSCPGLLSSSDQLSVVSLTPTTGTVTTLPSSVTAKFNMAASSLDATKFVMSGTCVNLPTVSSVSMSTDNLEAIADLTGGVCQNGQTLTVTVTPASLTDLEGVAGAGPAKSSTYTMHSTGPTAALGTPSATLIRNNQSSVIALTYTGATTTTLTNSGVTKNESGVSCQVNVTGISAAGATLTVSNCTGTGSLTVSVNAGTATNANGDLSTASPQSEVIHVDNTGPTLVSLTPASGTRVAAPTSVVATFSEKMTSLVPGNFVITGTCSPRPTVSGVSMSADGTIATAALSGGTCTELQTVIVTVTPSSLTDEAGNAGTGSAEARTYTISTAGPTATLATPSVTRMNSSGISTIALTYDNAVSTTLTDAGITKNQTGTTCTVNVSNATAAGATLTVRNCSGSGTITVAVNAGTAKNSLGSDSSASAPSAVITIDNTSPTLLSLSPGSGTFAQMPSSVDANFSEEMTALTPSNFVVSGTCSTLPTVTGVTMDSGGTTATASLSASTCTANDTITVSVNPATTHDAAGNVGTGSVTAVTFTKIDVMAALEIQGDDDVWTDCNGDFSLTVYNYEEGDASITNVLVSNTNIATITSTTCSGTLTAFSTCEVNLKAKMSGLRTVRLTVNYHNLQQATSVFKDLNVEYNGCFNR